MKSSRDRMLDQLGDDSRRGSDPRALLVGLLSDVLGSEGKVYAPSIERTGDKVIIPEGANLPDVISSLQRQHSREEQVTMIHVTIPVSPWDGAMALTTAVKETLGVINQLECSCGRPGCGVHQMDVEVALGKTIQVPWGRFELTGMEGAEVETGTTSEDGRVVFRCNVTCKRKYEGRIRRMLDRVREIASKESLHKGKAFSIEFTDEDGDTIEIPKPKFFEMMNEKPYFRAELEASIDRNIVVPITQTESLIKMGESVKIGVLFAGEYGVGKTLLASTLARLATENGWTFIYVKNSEELEEALIFAQQYQPVVVFAEDVDRVAGLERTDEVNELLNQLDGIDSKSAQIITVLTSNDAGQINPAMRRPGRIDLVLEVLPPDAPTVERMIKGFAKGSLDRNVRLDEVGKILEGETPARIRETVSRAKREALRRTDDPKAKINTKDLIAVAQEVKREALLFRKPTIEKHPNISAIAESFVEVGTAMKRSMNGSGHSVAATA